MWVAVVVVYLCVLCVLIGSLLIKRKRAETPLGAVEQDNVALDDEKQPVAHGLRRRLLVEEEKRNARKERKAALKQQRAREREALERHRKFLEDRKLAEVASFKEKQAELERIQREKEEEALKSREEAKKRKETEEYDLWKGQLEVNESGFGADDEELSLGLFLNRLKSARVCKLEDLGSEFGLSVKNCADRINSLLEQQLVFGCLDERGCFYHVSDEDLEKLALFIERKGRVSFAEIAKFAGENFDNPESSVKESLRPSPELAGDLLES